MKEQPVLQVDEVEVDSLVPYARNAKIHTDKQVGEIAASISEFGFDDPVGVWTNEDGELEIVEGHGRVLAAKRLGLEKIPVIRLDHLSNAARRAYTHVHNQTTLSSGFDFEILDGELATLDYDFAEFGFDLGDGGEDAPGEFREYGEDIEVGHVCPKCGYEW